MYTIRIYNGSTEVYQTIAKPLTPGNMNALESTAYALAQDCEYTHWTITPYTEA